MAPVLRALSSVLGRHKRLTPSPGCDENTGFHEVQAGGSVMSATELDHRVLAALRQQAVPAEPRALATALSAQGLDERAVLGSVWRLVDQNQAQFTPDRKVEPVPDK